ncbi:DUF6381 family protein [Streptomyces sp. NPDC001970]
MATAGEPVRTPEQLRVMAEELTRGAERCNDPEHRERLRRKAEQLRDQCEDTGTRTGDSRGGSEHGDGGSAPGARARRPRPDRKRGT